MAKRIPPELQCKCPTCGADSNMFVCQTCNQLKPWHNGGTDGLECDECWKGDTMKHLDKLLEPLSDTKAKDIRTVVERIVANAVQAATSQITSDHLRTQATLTEVREQVKREAEVGIAMTKDRDQWRKDRDFYKESYTVANNAIGQIAAALGVTVDNGYATVVNAVENLKTVKDGDWKRFVTTEAELIRTQDTLKSLGGMLGISTTNPSRDQFIAAMSAYKARNEKNCEDALEAMLKADGESKRHKASLANLALIASHGKPVAVSEYHNVIQSALNQATLIKSHNDALTNDLHAIAVRLGVPSFERNLEHAAVIDLITDAIDKLKAQPNNGQAELLKKIADLVFASPQELETLRFEDFKLAINNHLRRGDRGRFDKLQRLAERLELTSWTHHGREHEEAIDKLLCNFAAIRTEANTLRTGLVSLEHAAVKRNFITENRTPNSAVNLIHNELALRDQLRARLRSVALCAGVSQELTSAEICDGVIKELARRLERITTLEIAQKEPLADLAVLAEFLGCDKTEVAKRINHLVERDKLFSALSTRVNEELKAISKEYGHGMASCCPGNPAFKAGVAEGARFSLRKFNFLHDGE